jgi:hypothetical protein
MEMDVSEEHATSIFRADPEDNIFLRDYMVSYLHM